MVTIYIWCATLAAFWSRTVDPRILKRGSGDRCSSFQRVVHSSSIPVRIFRMRNASILLSIGLSPPNRMTCFSMRYGIRRILLLRIIALKNIIIKSMSKLYEFFVITRWSAIVKWRHWHTCCVRFSHYSGSSGKRGLTHRHRWMSYTSLA